MSTALLRAIGPFGEGSGKLSSGAGKVSRALYSTCGGPRCVFIQGCLVHFQWCCSVSGRHVAVFFRAVNCRSVVSVSQMKSLDFFDLHKSNRLSKSSSWARLVDAEFENNTEPGITVCVRSRAALLERLAWHFDSNFRCPALCVLMV